MMCAYAGADYESVEYEVTGSAPNYDRSAWFDVKPTFKEKNALMNLPYVKVGDSLVTQSNACLLFLGRCFNLNGSNEAEIASNDQIISEAFDLRNKAVMFFYSPSEAYAAAAPTFLEKFANVHFDKFEAYLGQTGKNFASADIPLSGDFSLFEMLDQHVAFGKTIGQDALKNYPRLAAYHQRFLELDQLKGYFAGDQYKLPVNNIMASFK
mmetsp:Transcript_13519/g.53606  ORF Transcript_13519/g.53606 Transcript_13519/m.53606 type:complete len:210 (-) Transcript_13519:115-744(-)